MSMVSPPTRSSDDFAAREVDFILSIGGITVKHGKSFGKGLKLKDLQTRL